jgi:hypothetical protein
MNVAGAALAAETTAEAGNILVACAASPSFGTFRIGNGHMAGTIDLTKAAAQFPRGLALRTLLMRLFTMPSIYNVRPLTWFYRDVVGIAEDF